jgi:hypothetical protein
MSGTTTTIGHLKPPANEVPLADDGTHTQAWSQYFRTLADQLNTRLAGVTDGSDAPAGNLGEYLVITGSGSVTTATPVDRATLSLPAGDWDVSGSATITPSAATMTFAQAWLSAASASPTDPGRAAIQSGGTGTLGSVALVVGPVRFSVSATTSVHLGVQANFPGTTSVTAGAFIQARRAR